MRKGSDEKIARIGKNMVSSVFFNTGGFMLMYKFKSEFLSSVIGPKEFFQNEVLKHQGIESSMFFFFFFRK